MHILLLIWNIFWSLLKLYFKLIIKCLWLNFISKCLVCKTFGTPHPSYLKLKIVKRCFSWLFSLHQPARILKKFLLSISVLTLNILSRHIRYKLRLWQWPLKISNKFTSINHCLEDRANFYDILHVYFPTNSTFLSEIRVLNTSIFPGHFLVQLLRISLIITCWKCCQLSPYIETLAVKFDTQKLKYQLIYIKYQYRH